jgi:hypothetical protein
MQKLTIIILPICLQIISADFNEEWAWNGTLGSKDPWPWSLDKGGLLT